MTKDDEALGQIWMEGGKAHVQRVATLMNISFDYVRGILYSLGRRDYLDIGADEIAVLAPKGEEHLEKQGMITFENAEERKKREAKRMEKEALEEIKREEIREIRMMFDKTVSHE
ncbi:MAG: hypothetical protein WC854_08100 [Bacteroidales bacterium]